jgi:hypothetical protein
MRYHMLAESLRLTQFLSALERLLKDWVSPIYAFFDPTPSVVAVDGRRVHEFRCTAASCKGRGKNPKIVRRYLDTSDRNSTGNLRKHARICWGDDVVHGADACADIGSARKALDNATKRRDGSITAAFERKGKGKRTYSHRQHTKAETRFVRINDRYYNRSLTERSGPSSFVGYRKICDLFLLSVIKPFKAS